MVSFKKLRIVEDTWVVTVKLETNPNHDPENKNTGACPVSYECTDSTGQHHSFIVVAKRANDVKKIIKKKLATFTSLA